MRFLHLGGGTWKTTWSFLVNQFAQRCSFPQLSLLAASGKLLQVQVAAKMILVDWPRLCSTHLPHKLMATPHTSNDERKDNGKAETDITFFIFFRDGAEFYVNIALGLWKFPHLLTLPKPHHGMRNASWDAHHCETIISISADVSFKNSWHVMQPSVQTANIRTHFFTQPLSHTSSRQPVQLTFWRKREWQGQD